MLRIVSSLSAKFARVSQIAPTADAKPAHHTALFKKIRKYDKHERLNKMYNGNYVLILAENFTAELRAEAIISFYDRLGAGN